MLFRSAFAFNDDEERMQAVENVLENLRNTRISDDDHPTAVNWTWGSWLLGGPSCNEISRYSLVDIDESVFKDYFDTLSSYMESMVSLFFSFNISILFFYSDYYLCRVLRMTITLQLV